jgi:hypothetical protein
MANVRAGTPPGEGINLTPKVSIDPTTNAEFDAALAALQAGG